MLGLCHKQNASSWINLATASEVIKSFNQFSQTEIGVTVSQPTHKITYSNKSQLFIAWYGSDRSTRNSNGSILFLISSH